MRKKRVTRITSALNSLSKTDTYSLMLFTLYKLKDLPEYSTLCELCYLLDGDNLSKLLSYFGGMTITIPTLKDMRLILKVLTLYQYANLEEEDFEDALNAVAGNEFSIEEVKSVYKKLLEVISNYEFRRE